MGIELIIKGMKNTTFMEKFDKSIKFYDNTYHMQKATYKGLTAIYKKYSETQKYYADLLIGLAKDIRGELP